MRHNVGYGRRIYVTGNIPSLGSWKPKSALRMKWNSGDVWVADIKVDGDERRVIEYKYGIVVHGDVEKSSWEWEVGENHVLRIGNGGGGREMKSEKGRDDVVDFWGGGGGVGGKGGSGVRGGGEWLGVNGNVGGGDGDCWGGREGGEPPPTPRVGVDVSEEELVVKSALEKLGRNGGGVGLLGVVGDGGVANGPVGEVGGKGGAIVGGKGREEKCVVFRIKYHTTYGENVYVVGGIPEVGNWNKDKAVKLKYQKTAPTPGLWELAVLIPRSKKYVQFEYKYFVMKQDGSRRWENGNNRVAKPFLKSQHVAASASPDANSAGGENEMQAEENCDPNDDDEEVLVLDDRWDKIRIEFSIFFPTGAGERMYITGDPPELGAWYRPGPLPMHLGEKQKLETDVDGQKWIKAIYVDPSVVKFSYRYIVIHEQSKKEIWEREPNRQAQFEEKTPSNSVFVCRDVNFVGGMKFDEVPPDMFIGPYPQTVDDIDLIHKAGATAIFNVQTDQDFHHRGIQWHVLMARYNALDIEVCRYPITDFDATSLHSRLLGAAKLIDDLISRGKQVYIHCTAGMGRAPAVAVAYLCWAKNWDLDEAVAHVKKYRTVAVPNVPVLRRALAEYTYESKN